MKRSGFSNKPRKPLKRSAFKASTRPKVKSKRTKASIARRKKGIWSTLTADKYFSLWIRERDGKCLRCERTEGLTCSHYHKRAISITRFCPINCITLCGECHAEWEGPKEGYTDLMINRLGVEGYIELKRKSGRFMARRDAVEEWKNFYKSTK